MKTGIYQHYKGKLYQVIGTAQHSETQEKLVVYIPLYIHEGEPMSVRPYDMFNDHLVVEINGAEKSVKRFQFLGESFTEAIKNLNQSLLPYSEGN